MAEKKKGVIDANDWDNSTGVSDKQTAIVNALYDTNRGGMNQQGMEGATGIKWMYGPLKQLFEDKRVEKKKMGRSNYYRLTLEEHNKIAAERGDDPATE